MLTVLVALTGCQDYSLVGRETDDTDTDTDIGPIDTDDTDVPTPPPTPLADAPVAVCSVSPGVVTPPNDAATFDGSGSYDPNGLSITTYTWTLSERPQGSSASMPNGGAVRSGFLADLAGLYVGRLVVTNEAGVDSLACEAELEAVPSQDLWVEMYWSLTNDDMDLHMLAPGGTPRTATDCYFANCRGANGLEWGNPGNADNPRLDLDDIGGTGPENINIDEPSAAGGYTVFVHDYPGSNNANANAVTVNVYLSGALVWTSTRNISGEDSDTYFAQINWQQGTVTPL